MNRIKRTFTKWYIRKGYKFGYDLSKCDFIGDEIIKIPTSMPAAVWECPPMVRPLLVFFSPSVYTAETLGKGIAAAFAKGIEEALKQREAEESEADGNE